MDLPSPFHCVLDARASLGECALWSIADRALYWVDINAPSLNRFEPASGANTVMPMPSSIGSYAFHARGGFVVALRDGIWRADSEGQVRERITGAPYDPRDQRFNDGRCDRQGRFLVGTINEKRDANTAALYRLGSDGELVRLIDGLMVSNGLAWSPDGHTMYHADTPTCTVQAYDYDIASGMPARRREFAQWRNEGARPDGATTDSEGCYWIAFYGSGKVARVSPSGETLSMLALPAMCPTMCALGGPALRTLFVTTARQHRPQDELLRLPQSGGIFAMEVDVPGLPESAFQG